VDKMPEVLIPLLMQELEQQASICKKEKRELEANDQLIAVRFCNFFNFFFFFLISFSFVLINQGYVLQQKSLLQCHESEERF
jgi:hypothetical protein